jgi:hypothetical protein
MCFPYVMLRSLEPQTMTPAEQRLADEQLGQIAAALAGTTRRIAAQAHAVAALPARRAHQSRAIRKSGPGHREPDLAARR